MAETPHSVPLQLMAVVEAVVLIQVLVLLVDRVAAVVV
jgi:hypothetical protein